MYFDLFTRYSVQEKQIKRDSMLCGVLDFVGWIVHVVVFVFISGTCTYIDRAILDQTKNV